MNADDIFKMVQPFIAALIGGGMTLLAIFMIFKRTSKAAVQTERRRLSHDSAREITSQLAVATGIGRRHRDYNSLDLTEEGRALLAECVATMEHHKHYIDDEVLHASVDEANDFLRPPPQFEDYLGKSVPVIIHDLQQRVGPMVQAHVHGKEMPVEPTFLADYRSTFKAVDDIWEAFMEYEDEKRAEERKARKAFKAADMSAQTSSDSD